MLMLLAKQINGYYCDSWNPTDPGDFLNKAYRSINPTEKNPTKVLKTQKMFQNMCKMASFSLNMHHERSVQC